MSLERKGKHTARKTPFFNAICGANVAFNKNNSLYLSLLHTKTDIFLQNEFCVYICSPTKLVR
jgi:hypothetical protein